jgi:antitoxin ParD1/3/4
LHPIEIAATVSRGLGQDNRNIGTHSRSPATNWQNMPTVLSSVALFEEAAMPTRNVVLTQHHEEVIDRLVKSGRYQNASEVLRDGLRLVEQRDALESAKLVALQKAAQAGFLDLDRGRYTEIAKDDIDEFIAGLGRQAATRARNFR